MYCKIDLLIPDMNWPNSDLKSLGMSTFAVRYMHMN